MGRVRELLETLSSLLQYSFKISVELIPIDPHKTDPPPLNVLKYPLLLKGKAIVVPIVPVNSNHQMNPHYHHHQLRMLPH